MIDREVLEAICGKASNLRKLRNERSRYFLAQSSCWERRYCAREEALLQARLEAHARKPTLPSRSA
jgi:hypothetical protein